MKEFFGILLIIVTLWISSPIVAIFLGISYAIGFNLHQDFITKSIGSRLLQIGIVLLGFTISITKAFEVASVYLPSISFLVLFTFIIGILLGKIIGVDKKLSILIASGAAICGATAMAAVAPILKAKPQDLLTAITIIFLLNAAAIIIFPLIGSFLDLSQNEFGAWVAMAIHDTSSVIGAAMIYGDTATESAATLKLGRTLWLIPLVIFLSLQYKNNDQSKAKLPIFVLFFVIAISFGSYLNFSDEIISTIRILSHSFLLIGLFCIGTQINKDALSNISMKPLQLSLILWLIVILASYLVVV